VAAVLAVAGTLLTAGAVGAIRDKDCLVVNAGQHTRYETLQSAVDAANAGDLLRVDGVCVGSTTIVKSLTIVGHAKATLDGADAGRVLTIGDYGLATTGVTVTMRDLVITHGFTQTHGGGIGLVHGTNLTLTRSTVIGNRAGWGGGGISVFDDGLVILDGGTVVTANAAGTGGGIEGERSVVILNDSSSVYGNFATDGAGIQSGTGAGPYAIVLNDRSSVHDNTASGDGGGISIGDAAMELNDASSIYGNTAARNGGGLLAGFASVSIRDRASIHGNSATAGGGVWAIFSNVSDCQAGVNVFDNTPDDVFEIPAP
jgi:nitrous oxidase accessory protein NosD